MKKSNTKFLVTIFIVLFSLFNAIPALFQSFIIMPKLFENKSVRLGLDLQGGSQLLLQIESIEALQEKLQNLSEDIRIKFDENKIFTDEIAIVGDEVEIKLTSKDDLEKALSIIKDFQSTEYDNENNLIRLSFNQGYIKEFNSSLILQSLEIIRKRIDELGTNEPI